MYPIANQKNEPQTRTIISRPWTFYTKAVPGTTDERLTKRQSNTTANSSQCN